VADYYTLEQLAQKLGITASVLAELELKGLLQPKLKDGRRFFPSRQMYELRLALRVARKQKLTLEEAFARVEDLRRCKAGTTGS
jgi:DNA-binding transcriptional MerR regulator